MSEPRQELPLAGRPRPERSDAAANRARVLAAARDVLAEHGHEGFTMDAVATAAGVGKGTIFRRFGDRAGLAMALIDTDMREFQDRFLRGPAPLGPGASPAERLEAFFAEWIRHQLDHLDTARLADALPAERGAASALIAHATWLVSELDSRLDAPLVARMLLAATGPSVIADARARGESVEAILSSARALVRGIFQTASASDR